MTCRLRECWPHDLPDPLVREVNGLAEREAAGLSVPDALICGFVRGGVVHQAFVWRPQRNAAAVRARFRRRLGISDTDDASGNDWLSADDPGGGVA